MSRNTGKPPRKIKKIDRRVRRTRDALGDSLVELMHEKAFDDITVQHVLDLDFPRYGLIRLDAADQALYQLRDSIR